MNALTPVIPSFGPYGKDVHWHGLRVVRVPHRGRSGSVSVDLVVVVVDQGVFGEDDAPV